MTPATPPALVLLNPHAGGGRALRLREALAGALAAADPACAATLAVPDTVDEALARIDALPPARRVVVVGGDGTVNRLLPALLRGGHTLALVPAGSGNDTARALGVRGLGPTQALAVALTAPAVAMDVGEAAFAPAGAAAGTPAQVVPFASSLTAGFDSAVGLRAIQGPRALRGLPRYLLATFRELTALRNWPLRVEVDGRLLHDGPLLFASTLNTPTYASGMPCVPHARTTDGRLDALLAGPFGRLGTLVVLPLLLAGQHLRHPRVRTHGFATMTLRSSQPIPLAADGEYLGETHAVTLTVRPGALPVVVR